MQKLNFTCRHLRTISSRPMTGSSCPFLAASVRSLPYLDNEAVGLAAMRKGTVLLPRSFPDAKLRWKCNVGAWVPRSKGEAVMLLNKNVLGWPFLSSENQEPGGYNPIAFWLCIILFVVWPTAIRRHERGLVSLLPVLTVTLLRWTERFERMLPIHVRAICLLIISERRKILHT